jgi:esterase/lipase
LVNSLRAFFTSNFAFMNAASMLLCLFSFTGSPSDVSLKIKNQIS